jgi:hypothetical protein
LTLRLRRAWRDYRRLRLRWSRRVQWWIRGNWGICLRWMLMCRTNWPNLCRNGEKSECFF